MDEYLTGVDYRHCVFCGRIKKFRKVYTGPGFGNIRRKRFTKWVVVNKPCNCKPILAEDWDYSI